jgi:hypothetical protein
MPKKKREPKTQMERAHAARSILHSQIGTESLAFRAFMEIFHPEFPEEKVHEVAQEIKKRGAA